MTLTAHGDTHGDTNPTRRDDRAAAALDAYREHGTWAKAAEVAGYTNKGSAYRAAMKLLGRRVDATVAQLREEANARTAERMAVLSEMVYDLDLSPETRLRAHAEFTRLEARHARLNGMDAPIQVALSAGVAADLEDALAEAEAVLMPGEVLAVHDEPIQGGDDGEA